MSLRKLVNLKCRLRNALRLRDLSINPFWTRAQRHRYRADRHNALQYLASGRFQRDRQKFLAACGR